MTPHLFAAALVMSGLPVAAEERFMIRIDLTEEASTQLVERNEWITALVSFTGEALPAAPESSWGKATLGYEEVMIYPVNQVVEFGGSISAMPQDWVEEVRVTMSIISPKSPEGVRLIICDVLEQPLTALVENGVTTMECVWAGD